MDARRAAHKESRRAVVRGSVSTVATGGNSCVNQTRMDLGTFGRGGRKPTTHWYSPGAFFFFHFYLRHPEFRPVALTRLTRERTRRDHTPNFPKKITRRTGTRDDHYCAVYGA